MKSAQFLKQAQNYWATFVTNPEDFNISIFAFEEVGSEDGLGYEITIDGHDLFNNYCFDASNSDTVAEWMESLFDEEPTIIPFRKERTVNHFTDERIEDLTQHVNNKWAEISYLFGVPYSKHLIRTTSINFNHCEIFNKSWATIQVRIAGCLLGEWETPIAPSEALDNHICRLIGFGKRMNTFLKKIDAVEWASNHIKSEEKKIQSATLNEEKSPLTPEQHEDLSKSIAQAIEKEPQHKEDTMKTKSILAQSLEAIKAKTKVKTVGDCMNFEEVKQVFDAITGGSPALERIEYNEDAEACIIGWFDNGDSGCAFYADYGSNEKELCEHLEGVESAEIATELFNGYIELAEHVNEIADYDGSMEHITINKPDFEAAQEAAKELEEEKMRKLKALTDAAETMIQEHGNEVKTEKHDDAEVLIDSIQDAVFGKEVVRLSAESRNMLRMKFFKGLGDYEVYDNSIIFTFNPETRVVSGSISGVKHDIVTLAAGVSPDKWAMDGRRNWRPLKKFIDWVKTGVWVEVTEDECQEQEKTYWDEMDRQEREEARENRAKKKREEAKKKKWEEFDDRWKKAWGDFERNWKHFEEKWGNQPQSNKQKLFQILGCKDGDNIKRAYRSWMKANHPDTNPNADLSLVQEVNAMMDTFNKS